MPALARVRRSIFARLGAAAVIALAAATARTYPTAPVRVIVPFGAGGATDVAGARVLRPPAAAPGPAVHGGEPGRGGRPDRRHRARARPADGYTLMFTTAAPITIAPLLSDKVQYDPRKDFVPIALVAVQPVWLVVNANSPLKSAADVVKQAKDNPGKLTYGTSGVGTELHLAAEAIARSAGIQMVHVPFRGGAEVITALLGIRSISRRSAPPRSRVRCGRVRLRALAVSSPQRHGRLSRCADLRRARASERHHAAVVGLDGAGGHAARDRHAADPGAAGGDRGRGLRERLKATFVQIEFAGPQEFSRKLEAETALYGEIIRAARIKQD